MHFIPAVAALAAAARLPFAKHVASAWLLAGTFSMLAVWTFVLGTGFGSYLGAQRAGHWVGGALTDAGGLPLFNWSRSGGDLRVAHFFGIHAMHFVPAIAALAAAARLPGAKHIASAWLLAAAFSALTVWTFVQAARGQPFLSIWF